MSNSKRVAPILLLVCLALLGATVTAQDDFGSGAIKAPWGFLLVWNAPANHYTLEIRGSNVRQISTERILFNVDGMFLQIVTAPTKNFLEVEKAKAMTEKAVLEAHRDWEVKFMERDYKADLPVESSWQKMKNGKDALLWNIKVPEGAKTSVRRQVSLTLIKGDFVLMLGGVVTDTIAENDTQQLLIRTADSLTTSDQPINMSKLQEAIRKEAGVESPNHKSKFANMKGKVFRSDTKEPIANALILLMDENKSAKHDRSIEARTNDQGYYSLENVPSGTYTVSIRAWYKTQEEAPCQLLMAKTPDKNSAVAVITEKDGVVQQVFIKGFAVKAGKDMAKDFDFACKGLFGG